jgi:hypothetical protein
VAGGHQHRPHPDPAVADAGAVMARIVVYAHRYKRPPLGRSPIAPSPVAEDARAPAFAAIRDQRSLS